MTPSLSAWGFGEGARAVAPTHSGLINQTFVVEKAGRGLAVLQRLNTAIFRAEVHEDIEAVTRHLTARGVPTPLLIPCTSGDLWHTDSSGQVWRCLTLVGDTTMDRFQHSGHAGSAGHTVGRWHEALKDLDWSFRSVREGAHDTPKHMGLLASAVEEHRAHRLYDEVAALAETIAGGWEGWEGPRDLPVRVIHGDLKVSNLRFTGEHAMALIDLDTCAWGTLDVELGDALRSWCNPEGEDEAHPEFRLDWFEAALKGYADAVGEAGVQEVEWASIVPGVERICWELASRFCRDALCESYFGWDPKWGTAGDHNLHRARGQAALAAKVRAVRGDAVRAVRRARL